MYLICWLLCSRNGVNNYIDCVEDIQYLKSFYEDFKHYTELMCVFFWKIWDMFQTFVACLRELLCRASFSWRKNITF